MGARYREACEVYRVGCPDVLEVAVSQRPELHGRQRVGPDGRIDAGRAGRIRIEGETAAEAAGTLAEALGVPAAAVEIRVVEYSSQYVFVIGQIIGQARAVPYRGPETVLDLLHRVGGITPGAAPGDVSVVRGKVAEGGQPEVFHVDLRAILERRDQRTNITLQPLDQVFVGESRPCAFERCLPPWLRPTYEALCGMRRPGR
jgi:protein involved in polysaccharide export with SLBB domain